MGGIGAGRIESNYTGDVSGTLSEIHNKLDRLLDLNGDSKQKTGNRYENTYKTVKGIDYFTIEHDAGGYCKNGHFNIIPDGTEMKAGDRLYCPVCDVLIWKCINVEVTEKEI